MQNLPRLQPRRFDILPPFEIFEVMTRPWRPTKVDLVQMIEAVRGSTWSQQGRHQGQAHQDLQRQRQGERSHIGGIGELEKKSCFFPVQLCLYKDNIKNNYFRTGKNNSRIKPEVFVFQSDEGARENKNRGFYGYFWSLWM